MHIQTPTKIINSKAKSIFQAMLMSDLHLEYTDDNFLKFPVVAPILMLAGDIGRPDILSLQKFLLAQCQRFEHIFYVAGNHCFYEGEYEDRLRQLRQLASLDPRIHFLHKNTYLLPNKVRILGATLWTHIPLKTALKIGGEHYDYRAISVTDKSKMSDQTVKITRPLTVNDTNKWHAEEHAWLLQEIEKARINDEHVVIITHHAPSRRDTCSEDDKMLGHEDAYVNDHEADCVDPVRLWMYGHTHLSLEMTVNSTKIISNQYGYEGDVSTFRPNMQITLYDDKNVTVTDSHAFQF